MARTRARPVEATAGERRSRARARAAALTACEGAVSPVVGATLMLAISVAGIVAVLAWGGPAIRALEDRVELRAVHNQFAHLDGTLAEMRHGTVAGTAAWWSPSLTRGTLTLDDDAERWIIGVDARPGADFTVSGLTGPRGARDNALAVHNNHSSEAHAVRFAAWTWTGDSRFPANATHDDEGNGCADEARAGGAPGATPVPMGPGDSAAVCLFRTDGAPLPVDGVTLELVVRDGATGAELSRFFVTDVGDLRYGVSAGGSRQEVHHANGALLVGPPGGLTVKNAPPFGPPRDAATGPQVFAGILRLAGDVGAGGSGRFDLLLTLRDRGALLDDAEAVRLKVWVDGDTRDAWLAHLADGRADDAFTREAVGTGFEHAAYAPPGGFRLDLIVHTVSVQG